MNIRTPRKIEHRMVELKAKVDNLDVVRRKLTSLGARRLGTFRQIDVYFDVPEGRLKLREVEGSGEAELVYYERENIAGPKRSDVFILKVREPAFFKTLLGRLLKTRVTVEKVRENYRYRGAPLASKDRHVQIHLDEVRHLGNFVEFEMETSDLRAKKDRKNLRSLMKKLNIETKQLERLSYADLLPKNR